MNDGKYEAAVIAFREAVGNPKLTTAKKGIVLRNLALAFQELSKPDSAVHYSTLAAKCYRKNSYDYLINMASVDLITGKTNSALSKLLKAEKLNPDDLSINNTLGLLYLGDYGEEFADPEKALVYNKKAFETGNSPITEDILGRNYYDLENYELAEEHYEKVYNQYPDNLTYKLNLGMIRFKLNKTGEADLMFKKVIEQDSSYKETIELFKENNR